MPRSDKQTTWAEAVIRSKMHKASIQKLAWWFARAKHQTVERVIYRWLLIERASEMLDEMFEWCCQEYSGSDLCVETKLCFDSAESEESGKGRAVCCFFVKDGDVLARQEVPFACDSHIATAQMLAASRARRELVNGLRQVFMERWAKDIAGGEDAAQ
jgi:hypothetical protein